MQLLGFTWQRRQIPTLQHFRERLECPPCRLTVGELGVTWLPPLHDDFWDLGEPSSPRLGEQTGEQTGTCPTCPRFLPCACETSRRRQFVERDTQGPSELDRDG